MSPTPFFSKRYMVDQLSIFVNGTVSIFHFITGLFVFNQTKVSCKGLSCFAFSVVI